MIGIQFNNEAATVVFCAFVFVMVICVMWWIGIMEGARHRRLNRGAARDAAVEYKRKKEEGKRLEHMREKKKKRLEYIRKRETKKNEME